MEREMSADRPTALASESPSEASPDRRRLLGTAAAASLAAATLGVGGLTERAAAQSRLLQAAGKVTFLRVHEVGTKFGPSGDQLDAEVIFKLNTASDNAFGFPLRNDTNAATHRGMLDVLRDAFNNNWTVTTDYTIESGNRNGRSIRVWLSKP